MNSKWRVKEFEELSHYLPSATEQNHGSPHHDSQSSDRDLVPGINRMPKKKKSLV